MAEQFSELLDRYNALNKRALSLEAELSVTKDELADSRVSLATNNAAAASQVAAAIETLQARYETLQKQFADSCAEKLSCSKALRERNAELAEAKATIQAHEATISERDKSLEEAGAFVSGVHERLTTVAVPAKLKLEQELASMEASNKQRAQEIEQLTKSLSNVRAEFAAHKEESAAVLAATVKGHADEMAEASKKLDEMQKRMAKALKGGAADSAELGATRKLNEFLRKQFSEFKVSSADEYEQLESYIDGLKADKAAADLRAANLATRCENLAKDEEELRSCLDAALEGSVGIRSNGDLVSGQEAHLIYHGAFEGLWRRIGRIMDTKLPLGKATQHLHPIEQ